MFSLDSLFNRKMTKLFDLCILNILCIITSIPIVTIGVSWTALYTVTLAMSKDEEEPVVRMYFKAFRENLKKGIITGCLLIAGICLFLFDIKSWSASDSQMKVLFLTATFVLLAFWVMVACWIFPLMAKFENSVMKMFKNALLFSLKYFPVSLGMGIVTIGYTVFLMKYIFVLWIPVFFGGIVVLAYPWTFYVGMRFEQYLSDRESKRN